MVMAAEFTTTTVLAWGLAAVAVGFVLGWMFRPWLVGERLRDEYESKLAESATDLADTRARLSDTDSRLKTATTDLEAAQAGIVRLESDLRTASTKASDLETALENERMEKEVEIEKLTAEVAKLAPLQSKVAELEGDRGAFESARADVARLEGELAAASARARDLEGSLSALRSEKDAEISRLAATAATAAAPAGVTVVEPARDPAPEPQEASAGETVKAPRTASPEREAAMGRVVEIAARTRGGEPRVEDNLKRIRGIGPKIAAMLYGMEITSFRQIARFERDDIASVAAALDSFPDRIERDDWMSSAARLHEEKYGEPA